MVASFNTEFLEKIGQLLKEAAPDFTGNIQFNFSADLPMPKVNVFYADVTNTRERSDGK